ncbi:MAG: ATP-binding protein [Phycisphaerales bacterium]
MSLQRKFALLLGTLGLIVVINLATALWAVWILERELAGPLASINPVLTELHAIKRGAEAVGRALPSDGIGDAGAPGARFGNPRGTLPDDDGAARTPDERRAAVRAALAMMRDRLDRFERIETVHVRAGLSTPRNFRARVEAAADAIGRWLDTDDASGLATMGADLRALRELIELIEGRVIDNARHDMSFGRQLRSRVLFIVGASLGLLVLAGALAVVLVRRWVMRPVGALRDAAARIASGDLSHRIPVSGGDELALLSTEVNQMAGTIATMQEERVDRERLAAVGEMVRRIAHNLRNPLAGIRSLAELSRGGLPDGAPIRENQDRIVRTVDRFEGWLKGLLNATTPLRCTPRPIAVADWIGRVVEPLRPLAAARGVEIQQLTEGAPPQANLDPIHMEQAIVALVTNAIQASPNGSRVTVSAQAAPPSPNAGNSWELRVSDQGEGVANELRDKIFRPYFTTKRDGTGIGLAVARQVVDQHGGRIWVETPPTQSANGLGGARGASFVICLPLSGE